MELSSRRTIGRPVPRLILFKVIETRGTFGRTDVLVVKPIKTQPYTCRDNYYGRPISTKVRK